MKVLIVGATGMVGQGVLKACLNSPLIPEVLVLVRSPLQQRSKKLTQVLIPDFNEIGKGGQLQKLTDLDACFYCLGVSAAGLPEAEYRAVTYDLTKTIAITLHTGNPAMTFIYVSGTGADNTEQGPIMWARVKGATENALLNIGFKRVYAFRPGIIQPLHGIKSKTASYRWLYRLMAPIFPLLKLIAPSHYVTTQHIGNAMINLLLNGNSRTIIDTQQILRLSARM